MSIRLSSSSRSSSIMGPEASSSPESVTESISRAKRRRANGRPQFVRDPKTVPVGGDELLDAVGHAVQVYGTMGAKS